MKLKTSDFLSSLEKQKELQERKVEKQQMHTEGVSAHEGTQDAIYSAIELLARFIASHEPNVTVKNQVKMPTSMDVPQIANVVKSLAEVLAATKANKPDDALLASKLDTIAEQLRELPRSIEFPEMPEGVEAVTVKNQIDYTHKFDELAKTFSSIKPPVVTVDSPKVTVNNDEVAKVVNELKDVIISAVSGIEMPTIPSFDTKPVTEAVRALQKTIEDRPVVKPASTVAVTNPDGSTVGAPKAWGYNDKEDTGTYIYYGFSAADGSWKLLRKVIATGALRYATGASDYDTAWTDRATQTYTRYDEAF